MLKLLLARAPRRQWRSGLRRLPHRKRSRQPGRDGLNTSAADSATHDAPPTAVWSQTSRRPAHWKAEDYDSIKGKSYAAAPACAERALKGTLVDIAGPRAMTEMPRQLVWRAVVEPIADLLADERGASRHQVPCLVADFKAAALVTCERVARQVPCC
jgi:hypothetical protein